MRSEKLLAEDGDILGTQRKGNVALEAVTKQQLVKAEKTLYVL
jgi:hypothetical protein